MNRKLVHPRLDRWVAFSTPPSFSFTIHFKYAESEGSPGCHNVTEERNLASREAILKLSSFSKKVVGLENGGGYSLNIW